MTDDLFQFATRHPLVHANPLDSEKEALEKVAPALSTMRAQILRRVSEAREAGLTPDEYVACYGGLINTVRRRFTDLWKDGFLRHHPCLLTRPNWSGNSCVVWVAGRDPSQKVSRIDRLRAQLMENGIKPVC